MLGDTQTVGGQELRGDVRTECHRNTPLTDLSPLVYAGVCPQEIAHDALLGWFTQSIHLSDILQFNPILSEEATMAHHHLPIDNIAQRQVAEQLGECIVNLSTILCLDLPLKTIDHINLLSLMVSSGKVQEIMVACLPCQESQHTFDRERPSIHEVTVEEVFIIYGWYSVHLEDVHEIVVLSMNVSADCDLLVVRYFIVY